MGSETFLNKPSLILGVPNTPVKRKIVMIAGVMSEIMQRLGSIHKPGNGTALGNLVALTRFLTAKDGSIREFTRFKMQVTVYSVPNSRPGVPSCGYNAKDEVFVNALDNGVVCYEFETILLGRGSRKDSKTASFYVPVELLDLDTKKDIRARLVQFWRPFLDEEYSRIAQTLTRTADAINKLDVYDIETGSIAPVNYGHKLIRKSKIFKGDKK